MYTNYKLYNCIINLNCIYWLILFFSPHIFMFWEFYLELLLYEGYLLEYFPQKEHVSDIVFTSLYITFTWQINTILDGYRILDLNSLMYFIFNQWSTYIILQSYWFLCYRWVQRQTHLLTRALCLSLSLPFPPHSK